MTLNGTLRGAGTGSRARSRPVCCSEGNKPWERSRPRAAQPHL